MENQIKYKKLIYIANARMPTERAHGWQIMKMCESFIKAGVDLTLVVPRRWCNPFRGDPFEFYKVERKFKIVYLPCIDFLSFATDGLAAVLAFKLQASTFAISAFLYSSFYDIWQFFDTWKYQRIAKDVLRVRTVFFTRDHFSGFLLSVAGKKVFFEIHDKPRASRLMRLLMRNIRGLITTNEWKGEEARRIFGLLKEKILVAYNGVDTDQFLISDTQAVCQRKLTLPQDKKLVVYTGHLYTWKGVHTLARAIQWLPQEVEILFVGGTKKDIEEFKAFIVQNLKGFQDRLKVLGYKRHEEIPHFLCAADVIVVPTSARENIGLHETSPLKLFEGMAARRPLVVSDVPSSREVVSEREVTFFKADNPEDLASAIKQVLENSATSEEKIKNAWEKVRELSWENRAKKILEFIKLA